MVPLLLLLFVMPPGTFPLFIISSHQPLEKILFVCYASWNISPFYYLFTSTPLKILFVCYAS